MVEGDNTVEFPESEYRARVRRAVELMGEYGLDGLMVTGDFSAAPNYRYLSGHSPRDYQLNFARPHVMLLNASGQAILVVYHVNAENAADTSWVKDIREYTQPFRSDAVVQAAKDLGLGQGRIGAELGLEQRLMMPFLEYQAIVDRLPGAKFHDAAALIWDLRMIKSPAEVDRIRRADDINHKALKTALTGMTPGMTEADVFRTVATVMIAEGADRPPFSQILSTSSPKYRRGGHRSRFLGPSTEPLKNGDLVFVDSGCVIDGYWGEFNRMGVVGQPSDHQAAVHDTIRGIVRRSIAEAFKPGNTHRQVMEHMVGLYREYGLEESQYKRYMQYPFAHLGHGIGLTSSEPPLTRMDNDDTLKPGMTISVEAYLKDEIVYGSEEDILITETGAEILSEVDTGLYSSI